jgi:CPA1 family monovalent cation:H+ antiporter
MAGCGHLDALPPSVEPTTPEGCTECLAMGARWVHLRECLSCGHIGCCDSSPHQHASEHFTLTDHPVIRSFQPGEDWRWCYVDQTLV